MLASVALAARIDRAEMRLTESMVHAVRLREPALGAFAEPIADGIAAFAGPSSPMSKMIGVGFEGPPSEQRLGEIGERFRARGAPPHAEVATLADPAFLARASFFLRARALLVKDP